MAGDRRPPAGPVAEPPADPPVDPGPRPALAWLPLSALAVDHRYQRPLTATHVRRIGRGFAWLTFQPVTVTRLEAGPGPDRYAVLDGQHRVEAARLLHGQGVPGMAEVPCYVVAAGDLATQARAFLGINQTRLGVTSISLHHAAVAAGDNTACAVARILAAAGVAVPATQMSAVKPMQTAAVVALRKAVARWGEGAVRAAVAALAEAHPRTPGAFGASLLSGLARLFGEPGRPAQAKVVAVLAALDPAEINHRVRAIRRETRRAADIVVAEILRAEMRKDAGRAAAAAPEPAAKYDPDHNRPGAPAPKPAPKPAAKPGAPPGPATRLASNGAGAPVAGGPAAARRAREAQALIDAAVAAGKMTKCPPAYVGAVEGAAPVGPLPHYVPPGLTGGGETGNWREQHAARAAEARRKGGLKAAAVQGSKRKRGQDKREQGA